MLQNLLKHFSLSPAKNVNPRSANHALEELRKEFEIRAETEPKTRLPTHLPTAEFQLPPPAPPFYLSLDNKTRRVAALAWNDVTEKRNAQIFFTSILSISILSGVEGLSTLSASSFPLSEPQNLALLGKYSLTNVIPSCVWTTNEMSTVALSSGIDPAQISTLTGSALIKTTTLRSFRYVVATTTLISQLLRFFSVSVRASDAFKDNIRDGKERPFENISERVIRLAGRKSDVTVVSLDKYQDHIFPVFEDPAAVRWTIAEYSDNYNKPTFWTVDRRSYGHKRAFNKLNINDSWLVDCTSAGRRILILEADLVNEEGLLKNFSSVLVLADKPIGIRLIESEKEENPDSNLSVLCSALTHDQLLHNVRMWMRMGFSPASIQDELDFQFAKVLEAEAIVSNDHHQEQEKAGANEHKSSIIHEK
ncbi:hypothetical protein TL16_g12467 [Triparma laevis f. inornata]|uniref:Uncharacterized protein n=1 Tax=Triparma laevis f. inornata TaxID=1714386 RepID=A0A9W7BU79_9STRA|nr:hypothetical protein TL16_g12467 [Triparma laevis f. inornata]